jgi:hypothetical protein
MTDRVYIFGTKLQTFTIELTYLILWKTIMIVLTVFLSRTADYGKCQFSKMSES